MAEPNPFTPTFGVTPPTVVGRDDIFLEAREAFDEGAGAPGRAMLITGPRGSGKTVVLNVIEDEARSRNWSVITEDSRPGLLERLFSTLSAILASENGTTATQFAGVSLPAALGGVSFHSSERYPHTPGVRALLTELSTIKRQQGAGVLVTIDEIHASSLDALKQFDGIAQHMVREGREFAFAGAGLPAAVSDVLNDAVLTYLRRADRHELSPIGPIDAADAISIPIERAGRTIERAALNAAVEASEGYPFFLQLVGRRMWRYAADDPRITLEHARRAIPEARTRLAELVHAPALRALSPTDRRYLHAMAVDEGASSSSDLAERLHMTSASVAQYRARLIAEEIIESAGHGLVTFTSPLLREHIRGLRDWIERTWESVET